MTKKEYFNYRLKISPLSNRWFWFYTKVYMLINIICGCLLFLCFLLLLLTANLEGRLIPFFITIIIQLVLSIMIYITLGRLSPKGYALNLFYLWLGLIYTSLYSLYNLNHMSQTYFGSERIAFLFVGMIVSVAISLLWFLPNLIYFQNRKHLFEPEPAGSFPDAMHLSPYSCTPNTYAPNIASPNPPSGFGEKADNPSSPPYQYSFSDIFAKMENLKVLYNSGLVSQQEYEQKKQELLNRL